MIDPEGKHVRPGESDYRTIGHFTWTPAGARESLVIEVAAIFG